MDHGAKGTSSMHARHEQNARRAAAPGPPEMRCATVTAQVALAVIRLSRTSRALETALSASLSDIAGVSKVHVDSRRSVVHVLYDGRMGAAEEVHRFLVATGWARTETACSRPPTGLSHGSDPYRTAPALPERHP